MQTQNTNSPPVLSVTQLTNAIKLSLESTFPSIWLQGEISNFKPHTSGHLYFSIKDANAQISAVMFRAQASSVKMLPKDGDQVIVLGDINVYPQGGRYQIVVREMKLVGLGELLLKLEELKVKLHKMGWFKSDRKKPLPKFPKKIGVVTSPTGAAIQDMLHILTRRFSGFHLILNPVKVQGEGAAQEIAQAINQFNQHNLVDVLIVGRGGGSIEDLWAFNEEIVAEAIFNSKIPIISAVGHESDHCIADYVADVRAPTPSAAAELVIAEKSQQLNHLDQIDRRLKHSLQHLIRTDKHRLFGVVRQPMFTSPYALLGPWIQRLDDTRQELDTAIKHKLLRSRMLLDSMHKQTQTLKPTAQIKHFRQKFTQCDRALRMTVSQLIKHRKERLQNLVSALRSVDPKILLTNGYSILFSEKDNSVIKSVNELVKDQTIRILLSDGKAIATIKEIVTK